MGEAFQITSGPDTHVGLHIVKDQINKMIFLDEDHCIQKILHDYWL
jgi:hypothetical protein